MKHIALFIIFSLFLFGCKSKPNFINEANSTNESITNFIKSYNSLVTSLISSENMSTYRDLNETKINNLEKEAVLAVTQIDKFDKLENKPENINSLFQSIRRSIMDGIYIVKYGNDLSSIPIESFLRYMQQYDIELRSLINKE